MFATWPTAMVSFSIVEIVNEDSIGFQYMEIRLRNIVESRRAAPTNGDPTAKEEVQNEKGEANDARCPAYSIPSIVISKVPDDS
ncbi:hypothetical protein CIHG_09707 [Coccidioides immitis H538.4]|uniref:Uncharacterized protein n=2 Tax=Coccidioides immitis TaxID=5501 RepID=A0A0J8S519_COCIT|nr:hypothetical protein CIRG_09700 [Coccidioides immitis RMSCC 2394]KMU91926.1 hypothetical protein CIHG_09707 [Coccidioides immitis H538.4]